LNLISIYSNSIQMIFDFKVKIVNSYFLNEYKIIQIAYYKHIEKLIIILLLSKFKTKFKLHSYY